MKFQTVLFYLPLILHLNSYAMEQSATLDVKTKQIALLQTISRELGSEKKPAECDDLITEAQERDWIATQIKGNQHRPMQAPWRDTYKKELVGSVVTASAITQQKRPCPFCDQFSRPDDDKKNFIFERHKHSVVMFNRSPYGPLHFLIIPYKHLAKMSSVPQEARQEIFENAQRWVKKLTTLGIDNAQLFFNLDDKCAGASLPDHLHCQLLSRWQGDESALASRLAEDLVDAERHTLLDSFYGIADKTIPKEEYESESTQPLLEQTTYQQSLNKLVSVYKPYKQLLDSLQKPLEEMLLESSDSRPKECYACLLKASTNDEFDRKHLVIKRFAYWILLLNRFGYIGGDSFLVTRTHGKSFVDLTLEELVELNQIIPLTQENLKKFVTAPGYNIGCSTGNCAGNPFPGHVCFNLIPRTPLDTAAITPCFGFNVIHENIPSLHERLTATFKDNLALQVPTIYPNQPVATSSLTNHVK